MIRLMGAGTVGCGVLVKLGMVRVYVVVKSEAEAFTNRLATIIKYFTIAG